MLLVGVLSACSTADGRTSRTTGPLSVGIVLTATKNAAALGASSQNTVSERALDNALIAGLNAQGGLHGRKIVPVYADTDTGSSNWATDFAAACSTFTQDHHVQAVLGYVFTYDSAFESCLARQGIPHLDAGFNIPDSKELSAYPLLTALDVPTVGRRGLLKLDGGVADGILTPSSRIGVVRDTCPGTLRSYSESFAPAAAQLRLTIAKTVDITCTNGNSDAGAAIQALQNGVLQFASAGVDRVLFHMASEGPALMLFALTAESQHYRPRYLVSSLGNLQSLQGLVPAAQLADVDGFGWLPTQDVPPASYPERTGSQRRCLSLLQAGGVKPVSGVDYFGAYAMCDAFFVYEAALAKTGGNSGGQAVGNAVDGLGTEFASSINLGGSAFGATTQDAPQAAERLAYDGGCRCFAYVGAPRAIPKA